MPMMVHLTSARNVQHIRRTGIHKDGPGVYCMPVLQDYYLSHQWLRELRRWMPGPLMAVYFRLDDEERVTCGPYWQAHRTLSVVEAVRLFRQHDEPMQGWEIVVPRSIIPNEIHKIRAISQVLGWRYSPGARSRPWCNCPVCVSRGEFNASKKRERRLVLPYPEILTQIQRVHIQMQTQEGQERIESADEIVGLLSSLYQRKAGQASDFRFLLDSPSSAILEALVDLLDVYKGRAARQLLREATLRKEHLEITMGTPPHA